MNPPTPERRFDILFHGEPLNGTAVSEVKENLRTLFKLGDADLERMFSGQPITIKKDLDRKTANQFQQALARAGAKIQLVLHQQAGKAQDGTGADAAPRSEAAGDGAVQNAPATGGMKLMPAGSTLGPENETESEAVEIDVSHLSIAAADAAAERSSGKAVFAVADPFAEDTTAAPAQGDGPRYPSPDHIELDTALSVAELGNLLERAEALPPLNVDIDHLSLAEAGAMLGEVRRADAPPPQISSELELAESGADLLAQHEKRVIESAEVDTSSLSLSDA